MNRMPMLAAVDLETVVSVVFVVLYGIAQLLSSMASAKKKAAEKAPRPVVPKAEAAAKPDVVPAGPQDQLRREVEEFLRRARGEAPRSPAPVSSPPKPQPQPARRPLVERGGSQRSNKNKSAKSSPLPSQQASAPRRGFEDGPPQRSESVAEHVRKHIRSEVASIDQHADSLSQHASQLGQQVGLADERMEEHLREKFSHRLGTLGTGGEAAIATGAVEGSSTMARELAEMLSRPAGVRQLIVASEILRRPVERWER